MHGASFARTHRPSANWLTGTRTLKNRLPWHRTPWCWTTRTGTSGKLTGRGTRHIRWRGTDGSLINRTRSRLRHNHARARLRPLRDRPSWSWRLRCRRGWFRRQWRSGLPYRLRRRGTRWCRGARGRCTRRRSSGRWCRRLWLHWSRDRVRRPRLAVRHNTLGRRRRYSNRFRRRRHCWPGHNRRGRHRFFNVWRGCWPRWSGSRRGR